MNTTVRMKASQITKDWHVIDAAGRPLGRVATEAATLLRGKHKPTFEPHLDGGDFVVIVNASKVEVSGAKAQQRKYYRHSGFPGGLKERSYTEQLSRFPDRVIRDAVWGMLPDGPLGKQMLRHLKVYGGPTHPHASQITGSERAKAIREAAQAEALLAPRKAPRLRPLSVPDAQPEAKVEAPAARPKAAAKPKAAPAAKAPAAKAPEAEAPAAKAPARSRKKAETAEEAAPVAEAPAAVTATAPEAEAAAEAPKKRAPRKKAEETTAEAPAADATTEEEAPKKPARRRTAAKQEE